MSRKADRRVAREGADGEVSSLPALSSLSDVPTLEDLTPTAEQTAALCQVVDRLAREGVDAGEACLGCVVRLDRGFPAVAVEGDLIRAEHSVRLAKGDETRPAVGDWVAVRRPAGHDMGVIEGVLPRRSELARWRGGARGERQTLAANVDVVLVAQQLADAPLDCDHIARSVVVALDGRAKAAVVLTKADRAGVPGLVRDVSRVRLVMGDDVDVVACAATDDDALLAELEHAAASAGAGWGLDAIGALVGTGRVGIVLGESGAGKSTLLNGLLGHEALEVGEVRAHDDAGRHTTVARRMVHLSGRGTIVDAPGLRSLPLVGHERGLMRAFPEISDAARTCRFRDCTHTGEPGCGVRAALDEGEFPPERLDVYLALASEMRRSAKTLDPDVVL